MTMISRSFADSQPATPAPRQRKGGGSRFPKLPLIMGFSLVGFAFLVTLLGVTTGIGTDKTDFGRPAAIRDVVFSGSLATALSVIDAGSGEVIATFGEGEGGFVRGSMRALKRIRFVSGAGTDFNAPYRIIRWENGAVSLSDTSTGERMVLNAFGPDNAAAFAQLIDLRGNKS